MKCPTPLEFVDLFKSKTLAVFLSDERPYNLNIVGWRNKEARVNYFDDLLAIYWQDIGGWKYKYWPITTLPGLHYLKNPLNKKGTALMVPGQYRNAYELGYFKNYIALKQVQPISVYRDSNKDSAFGKNPSTVDTGLFGIHIHRAGIWSKVVGPSSAGCQVFQKKADFESFIQYCTMSAHYWGNHFTYTLVEV